MSRIQPLQVNSYRGNTPLTKSKKNKDNLTFKGAKDFSRAQENVLDQYITKYVGPKKGWILNYLSKTTGEIQNLIVINIGTALIAPIFIVHNPMSKEDKKSRKYTAWRQPISAIIALGTSLLINMPAPKYVEKYLMKGKIKGLDLSIQPPESFTKRIYKKIIKDFDKIAVDNPDKKYQDANKFYNYAIDSLKNNALKNGETFTPITNKKDFLDAFANPKVFNQAVCDTSSLKYAEKLLDKKNPESLCNKSLKTYLADSLGFESDYINKDILNSIQATDKLSEMPADKFLNAFGIEASSQDIRTFIAKNIKAGNCAFSADERKVVSRVIQAWGVKGDVPNAKLLLKSIQNADKMFICEDNASEEAFKNSKEFLNQPVSEFLGWLYKNAKIGTNAKKKSGAVVDDTEKAVINMAKGMAKFASKEIKSNYAAESKIQGILLSLAVLPVSCGILNWAYPRVMSLCFPKLANSKTKPSSDSDSKVKGGKQ